MDATKLDFAFCRDFLDNGIKMMVCELEGNILEERYPNNVYIKQVKLVSIFVLLFILIILLFRDCKIRRL
jgi:hypothetical protein